MMNRLFPLALSLAILLLAAAPATAEPPGDRGRTLIVTYAVPPANRPAFRQQLQDGALVRLQDWKDRGILEDFRLLANRYVDAGNWDFMAVLSFASAAAVERWKEVERALPAGMPPAALGLTSSVSSVPADLVRQDGRSGAAGRGKTVFLVIPYQYLVPPADYVSYLDGYTIPQFKGWMEEKVLARFGLYLSRYPAGRPWNALLLLEYADEAALDQRDRVVAAVRARLKDDPDWKALADSKKSIRDERQAVLADEILAVPAARP